MKKSEQIEILKIQLEKAIDIAMEALHPSLMIEDNIEKRVILLLRLSNLKFEMK
jgi:hypothetical protein